MQCPRVEAAGSAPPTESPGKRSLCGSPPPFEQMVLLGMLSPKAAMEYANFQYDYAELQDKYKTLQQQCAQLKKTNTALEHEADKLRTETAEVKDENGDLHDRNTALERQILKLQTTVTELQRADAARRRELEELRSEMDQMWEKNEAVVVGSRKRKSCFDSYDGSTTKRRRHLDDFDTSNRPQAQPSYDADDSRPSDVMANDLEPTKKDGHLNVFRHVAEAPKLPFPFKVLESVDPQIAFTPPAQLSTAILLEVSKFSEVWSTASAQRYKSSDSLSRVLKAPQACAHTRAHNHGKSFWTPTYSGNFACRACASNRRPCMKAHDGEVWLLPLPPDVRGAARPGEMRFYVMGGDLDAATKRAVWNQS